MGKETWKDIPGTVGRYQASSLGRIRSVARTIGMGRSYKAKILKTPVKTTGYLRFNLSIDGKRRPTTVHRAVCKAFHGDAPSNMDARHLNGDRKDNRATNLAWGTRKENEEDKRRHGTLLVGEKKYNTVLTKEDVFFIRANKPTMTYAALAEKYGVTPSAIAGVVKRRSWAHVQ